MIQGILIVFGDIDFGIKPGEEGKDDQAIINWVYMAIVVEEENAEEEAELIMKREGYDSYIIPQFYVGEIIWKL